MENSGADIIMESSENGLTSGRNVQTINPQVLTPNQYMDPDSNEQSQYGSEVSSIRIRSIEPRKFYLPTGCCYDDRMKLHANADFSHSPHHPEDPRRIAAIFDHFKAAGLIYNGNERDAQKILKANPTQFMYRIPARQALKQEICLVHELTHYDWVCSLDNMSPQQLRDMTTLFDEGRKSLYVGNLTTLAAFISAGSAIETCKSVVEGKVKNAIAVIRPPGHHAEAGESMGFCIFNNVPIAAAVCREEYPEKCRKILILDWDVHHGNGIQNIFYKEPNVLYISLHVYQNGEFYPGKPLDDDVADGGLDNCGAEDGIGSNINIGWADQGVGDGEYMAAFQRIVMPIAQEFDPDLVIISAGFDAAAGDELGGCFVTPACYSHMTYMLMSLANGKVAVCLEGGYNLQAISRSALAVAKTLMGEPPEKMVIPPCNREARLVLDNVQRIQANWWNCMRPGVIPMLDLNQKDVQRLDGVVRQSQKSRLQEEFDMVTLYIAKTGVQKVYENMVICTPELHKAKRVLVCLHDPPDIIAQPNPSATKYSQDAHNAFISTPLDAYTRWAIGQGYAVLDITIPYPVPSSHPSDSTLDPYIPLPTEDTTTAQARSVLCFLWDNYLSLTSPSTPIVLLGAGDAYLGIKQLLISRDCRSRIAGVLAFIAGSIKPVKSDIDEGLSRWYGANSRIYVNPNHVAWGDEASMRKMRKPRFGDLVKADFDDGEEEGRRRQKGVVRVDEAEGVVPRMVRWYEKEATGWIEGKTEEWEERNGGEEGESEEDVEMGGAGEVAGVSGRGLVGSGERLVLSGSGSGGNGGVNKGLMGFYGQS